MAASVKPELGWDPHSQHNEPEIGRTYEMLVPRDHAGVVSHDGSYKPFIVIHQVANSKKYHVVRIDQSKTRGARPALDFFMFNANLEWEVKTVLSNFYFFPGNWYEVEGDPDIMRRWEGYTTVMSEEGVERLRAASAGFVDGWGRRGQVELGVIYWILPRYLGITTVADYIPCVALHVVRNNVRVVRMDPEFAHGARHAADFFKIDGKLQSAKLQTYVETIDFTTFYIFPHEKKEVKADPGIMQTWNGHITQMPEEGQDRLMAASLGLVDGWNPEAEPQVGGVYWILSRHLGIYDTDIVFLIPCVLIHRDGNRCCVVCIFQRKIKGGKRATYFFGDGAKLQTRTGTGEINLHEYYLVPGKIYEVKADPSIMNVWDGYFTKISQEGLENIIRTGKKQKDEMGKSW